MVDIERKYQKLTQIEHILKRPGMYIGGIEEIEEEMWVLENNSIVKKKINFSPGLYKIFDEVIVNAYDQSIRDDKLTKIEVDIDNINNQIIVFNNGIGIDVVIHPKEKVWVPELIFSQLLTSTSFDESEIRITGGIHGLGIKLTAIFSKKFKVEIGDPVNKKKFVQIYTNNLSIKSKAKITNFDNAMGYVKITYEPDLKYFDIKQMNDDLINLMKRRVYDIAALTKKNIKVYLNKEIINIKDFHEYVELFTLEPQVKENCDPESIKFGDNRWQIILTLSKGKFDQISFVNGIYTYHGGRHVDYISNKIVKTIKHAIQNKYKDINIKDQFIKDQLWIFIASVIENPTFSSQTKDELMTPINKFGSTCELSKGFLNKVFSKLDIESIIENNIRQTQELELSKLNVKKKTLRNIEKLYDANFAGSKKSIFCTLILTEGDSAKTMAISGLSALTNPKGNDYFGVFPLKGKLLNVREATHRQILNNEEFKNLQKIIGLEINKQYDIKNIHELRYGSIMLMMDADVDGSHIKGLFINMIDYYWPSLLHIDGFIKIFITPILKIKEKTTIISFYTLTDFENWEKKHHSKNLDIKYYKGLGTNTTQEAKEYFKNLDKNTINLVWEDDKSSLAIELAFSKEKADDRKLWLEGYNRNFVVDYSEKRLSYYEFINKELIHFSNYDNIRSIPNLVDGLKPSQRKVLFAAFKRNLTVDIKVAQFVGYVAEQSSYRHGESSLSKTIIAMAQNFIGSNNINLLMPNGQFGTRLMGGKDAASPRYLFTQLEKITDYIYDKNDEELLNYLNEEGQTIEPEYYVPIIPMVLVNGTEGIGTGYSTYIPKYNPLDIINNLINKINGKEFKNMEPWYNNFNGEILKINDYLYYSKGKYNLNGNILEITELPITFWTENFKNFLEYSMENDEFGQNIKSIVNNSTESEVKFLIKFKNNFFLNLIKTSDDKFVDKIEKKFLLVNKINLTNMYLYNSKNKITKYDNVIDIMEEFYKIRLEFYEKRKIAILDKLIKETKILDSKKKFIELVVGKKINLLNIPRNDLIKILEDQKLFKIPNEPIFDYLIRMPFYSFTFEKIQELNKNYEDKKKIYKQIKNKTIKNMWLDDLDRLLEQIK